MLLMCRRGEKLQAATTREACTLVFEAPAFGVPEPRTVHVRRAAIRTRGQLRAFLVAHLGLEGSTQSVELQVYEHRQQKFVELLSTEAAVRGETVRVVRRGEGTAQAQSSKLRPRS